MLRFVENVVDCTKLSESICLSESLIACVSVRVFLAMK